MSEANEVNPVDVIVMRKELDKFREETIAKANAGICEGSCEKHRGAIQCVRVTDMKDGYDWGYFSYCEEARDIDRIRGFGFIYVGA